MHVAQLGYLLKLCMYSLLKKRRHLVKETEAHVVVRLLLGLLLLLLLGLLGGATGGILTRVPRLLQFVGTVTGDLGKYGATSPFAEQGIAIAIGAEYREEMERTTVNEIFQQNNDYHYDILAKRRWIVEQGQRADDTGAGR